MINEVLENFKKIEIDNNPFSHKVINNIFPNLFYQELIDNLPSIEQYTPIVKTGRVSSNYSEERYIFELTKESVSKLNPNQQTVLNKIINLFIHPSFFGTIANEFKDIIDKRISEFSEEEKQKFGVNNFNFTMSTSLVKDLSKYELGVHTDSPSKFLTFLFYIPNNDNLSNLGTALYQPKEKNFHLKNKVSNHYSIKDFELVKKVDFLPNTLFIFPRTNYSYHGVQRINVDGAERNLLLLNFYFKEI